LLQVISLSILDTLKHILNNVSIKWPNDICVNNKKIAGVLIESSIQGVYINYAVCGIGLNINQNKFSKNLNLATSIIKELGKEYSIEKILKEIMHHMERYYNEFLIYEKFMEIEKLYIKNLYLLDEKAKFQAGGKIFTGRIVGVDKLGKLSIKNESNQISYYGIDEINYV